jgi:hypothetical protein
VLLDTLVVHPFALATRALRTDSIAQVIVLDGRPAGRLRRLVVGVADSVRVGGQWLPALRTEATWGTTVVRVWTDAADRLLAAEGLRPGERAVRDDPPGGTR